jgi:hypothetical protein
MITILGALCQWRAQLKAPTNTITLIFNSSSLFTIQQNIKISGNKSETKIS